jgi:hypothetical protein
MGEGKGGSDGHTENRAERGLVGAQISRKDFLRIGGTGLAGAALLGTAGCGGVFGGGQGAEAEAEAEAEAAPSPLP